MVSLGVKDGLYAYGKQMRRTSQLLPSCSQYSSPAPPTATGTTVQALEPKAEAAFPAQEVTMP